MSDHQVPVHCIRYCQSPQQEVIIYYLLQGSESARVIHHSVLCALSINRPPTGS